MEAQEASLSDVFDRAWANAVMKQAAALQAERAVQDEARRRVELLRLRFTVGLPMRRIAETWDMDRRKLQYQYDLARKEFEAALHEVIRRHHPEAAVAEESARLLQFFA